ncbi:agmatinase [bacterium]|nr:agmatinase [bacterium]MBU1651063.1 agmatinase [bacterium]
MTESSSPLFLSCALQKQGDWEIIGLPFDNASSYRGGARFGPSQIRLASDSIESYSPYADRDLDDLHLCDCGDLDIVSLSSADAVESIAAYYMQQSLAKKKLIGMGGDHTASIGAVKGLCDAGLRPVVLHLDAHMDLRDSYLDDPNSHASAAKRILDMVGPDHLYQWGMRSGERKEFEFAKELGTYAGRDPDALSVLCNKLQGEPIYITLDLDIFDPAELPGVGNPEPGGLRFIEFLHLLKGLPELNIVGFDVVELSPTLDVSGRSSVIAAEIIRELILTFA